MFRRNDHQIPPLLKGAQDKDVDRPLTQKETDRWAGEKVRVRSGRTAKDQDTPKGTNQRTTKSFKPRQTNEQTGAHAYRQISPGIRWLKINLWFGPRCDISLPVRRTIILRFDIDIYSGCKAETRGMTGVTCCSTHLESHPEANGRMTRLSHVTKRNCWDISCFIPTKIAYLPLSCILPCLCMKVSQEISGPLVFLDTQCVEKPGVGRKVQAPCPVRRWCGKPSALGLAALWRKRAPSTLPDLNNNSYESCWWKNYRQCGYCKQPTSAYTLDKCKNSTL